VLVFFIQKLSTRSPTHLPSYPRMDNFWL